MITSLITNRFLETKLLLPLLRIIGIKARKMHSGIDANKSTVHELDGNSDKKK